MATGKRPILTALQEQLDRLRAAEGTPQAKALTYLSDLRCHGAGPT